MKKYKKNFQKPQDGRSMVEMLGVLAIIGVLSIGAIAGYSFAILKHNTNTFWDTFNKLSILAQQRCTTPGQDNTDCWAESPDLGYEDAGVPGVIGSGGYFAVEYQTDNSNTDPCYYVSLRLLLNPKKMCEEIIKDANVHGISRCMDSHALDFYYGDCINF